LSSYRELMLQDAQLQQALSLRECIQNPVQAFHRGILAPLRALKDSGKIDSDSCIIVVDALNEAEFHKPDYGDTVASFLSRHVAAFPAWLKLVVTVQSALQEITKSLSFHKVCIDRVAASNEVLTRTTNGEVVARDQQEYISHRIDTSAGLRNNISLNGRLEPAAQAKFCAHLQTLSKGSFLYCKLTLDLIERGQLVLKSTNYKILPVNISEVFSLHFNLKFPSVRSFEKISPVLGVCLSTLYPLSVEEIYETVNSGFTDRFVAWDEFCQRLEVLQGLLHQRRDNTYVFFHPAFREWLIRRDEAENPKFLCDLR
jgi:hypothetical protein